MRNESLSLVHSLIYIVQKPFPSSQESSVGQKLLYALMTPSYNEDMTVINIYIPNKYSIYLKQQKWWKDAYPLQEKTLKSNFSIQDQQVKISRA